jgi:hypothetical protein
MNRPQGNLKEYPPGETGKELQVPVSVEKKAATAVYIQINSLQDISPSESNVERAEGARISTSNMFHLPKAKNPHQEGQIG